jgi:hypothetical protein
MRYLLLVLTFLVITFSCNKYQEDDGSNPVEIYLLSTVQFVTNKCQVDPANSTIETNPLVRNQDIIAYFKSDYEFKLTDEGIQKIKALHDNTPFAVTVNKEVIYYGFFKPNFSSSSCFHSITMDLNWTTNNKIMMRLGYPGQLQGVTIEDRRNDPMLLAALAGDKKLK